MGGSDPQHDRGRDDEREARHVHAGALRRA
jgi:hypothetical protein